MFKTQPHSPPCPPPASTLSVNIHSLPRCSGQAPRSQPWSLAFPSYPIPSAATVLLAPPPHHTLPHVSATRATIWSQLDKCSIISTGLPLSTLVHPGPSSTEQTLFSLHLKAHRISPPLTTLPSVPTATGTKFKSCRAPQDTMGSALHPPQLAPPTLARFLSFEHTNLVSISGSLQLLPWAQNILAPDISHPSGLNTRHHLREALPWSSQLELSLGHSLHSLVHHRHSPIGTWNYHISFFVSTPYLFSRMLPVQGCRGSSLALWLQEPRRYRTQPGHSMRARTATPQVDTSHAFPYSSSQGGHNPEEGEPACTDRTM